MTPETILKEVASEAGLKVADLTTTFPPRHARDPRDKAAFRMFCELGMSSCHVAKNMGWAEHSCARDSILRGARLDKMEATSLSELRRTCDGMPGRGGPFDWVKFAYSLAWWCERADISERQLARRTGLSPSIIHKARAGQRVEADALVMLCHTMGEDPRGYLKPEAVSRKSTGEAA